MAFKDEAKISINLYDTKQIASNLLNIARKYNFIIIIFLIIVISFTLRSYDIFGAGLTWDEDKTLSSAISYFKGVSSIVHLSLSPADSMYFVQINEHPPTGKYIYSLALFLFNGANYDFNGLIVCRYASALMGAFTCALTYLIGRELYEEKTGILAAFILTFTPVFVAHNQIMALDTPLAFMFTLTVLLFLQALKYNKTIIFACAAISTGLTVGTKLNGVIVIPIIGILLACWLFNKKVKINWYNLILWSICYLIIAINVFIWEWPWLWSNYITLSTNPLYPLISSLTHWSYVPQEYFLGILRNAPMYYYPVYFIVTTPVLLLILCFAGIIFSLRSKESLKLVALSWLALPFLYGLSNMVQDGMRYLLFIYPALALICAYGLVSLSNVRLVQKYVSRTTFIICSSGVIIVYLIILLVSLHPYYLDYYNFLSGGQQHIYDNKLFELGSWGEGISDSILYVDKSGAPGSIVLINTLPSDPDSTYKLIVNNMTYLTVERNNIIVYYSLNDTNVIMNKSTIPDLFKEPDYIIENIAYERYYGNDIDISKYEIEYVTKMGSIPLCTVYKKRVVYCPSLKP